MDKEKILVLGSGGQIGTELTEELRRVHGEDNIIAADIRKTESEQGIFEIIDVLDAKALHGIINKYNISQVYLLAAMLSATAEQKPQQAWKLNMEGLLNVLEIARERKMKIFWPSSIAVFGNSTPKIKTPQTTIMEPVTVYGISKLAGERWCAYYFLKYGVDVRSLRYPGLISYKSPPGGGTTDYAVSIFYEALEKKRFESFLRAETTLPMMYMPDAIRATLMLMNAPARNIKIRSSYNLSAFSFSPEEIGNKIKKHIPDFKITYKPDYRQAIAESWPHTIDDSAANAHWGWKPEYNLQTMTSDMLEKISMKKSNAISYNVS